MLATVSLGSYAYGEGTRSYRIGESEAATRVQAEAQACAARATAELKETCFRNLYQGLLNGRPAEGTTAAWDGSRPAFSRAVRSLPPPVRQFVFSSCRSGTTYEAREEGFRRFSGRRLSDPHIVSTCWRDRSAELERKLSDTYRILGEFSESDNGAGARQYFNRLKNSSVASHRMIYEFLSQSCDGTQAEYDCHADALENLMHNVGRGKAAISNANAYTSRFGIVEDICRTAMGLTDDGLCSRQFGLWDGSGNSLFEMQFGPDSSVLRGDFSGSSIPYVPDSAHAGTADGPTGGTGSGATTTTEGSESGTGTGTGSAATATGATGPSGGSRTTGGPGGKKGGSGISTESDSSAGSSHREGEGDSDPFTACHWDAQHISTAGFCSGEPSTLRSLMGAQAVTSMDHFNAFNYLELLRMEAISQTVAAHHALVGRRMSQSASREEVARLLRDRGCGGLSSGIANELNLPEPLAPRIQTDHDYRVGAWEAARRVRENALGARSIDRLHKKGYHSRITGGMVLDCPYHGEMLQCERLRRLGATGGERGLCSAEGEASYRARIETEFGFVSSDPDEIVRRMQGGGRVCATHRVLEQALKLSGQKIARDLKKYPYLAAGHSPTSAIHNGLDIAFDFAAAAGSAAQVRANPSRLDAVVEQSTRQLAADLENELSSYCDDSSGRRMSRWSSLLSTPLLREQLFDDLHLNSAQREQMAAMQSCMLEKIDSGGPLKMFAVAGCVLGSLVPGANTIVIPACAAGFLGDAYLEMSIAEEEAVDRHRCAFASHVCSTDQWITARENYNSAVDNFWMTLIGEGIGLPGYLKMVRQARAVRLARLQNAGAGLIESELDDFTRQMARKTRQLELAGQMPPGPERDALIARLSNEVDTLIDDVVDTAQRNLDDSDAALGRTAPARPAAAADDAALGRTAPARPVAADDAALGRTPPARPVAIADDAAPGVRTAPASPGARPGAPARPHAEPHGSPRSAGDAIPQVDPPEMPRGIPMDFDPSEYRRTYDRRAAGVDVTPAPPASGLDLIEHGPMRLDFPEVHYRPPGAGQTDLDLLHASGAVPDSFTGELQSIGEGGFRRAFVHPTDPNKVVKVFDPHKIHGFPTDAHIEHYRARHPGADTPTIVENLKRQFTSAMVQRDIAVYNYLVKVEEAYTAAGKVPPFRIARITSTQAQLERGIVIQERVAGTPMWTYWDDTLPRPPPAASRYFEETRRHQEAVQAAVSGGCDRLKLFACHGTNEIEELGIDWGGRYSNVVVHTEESGQDVAVMYDW